MNRAAASLLTLGVLVLGATSCARAGACRADADCGENQRCVRETCADTHCGDLRCQDTQVCIDGYCRSDSCVGVSCADGGTCAGGQCQPQRCSAPSGGVSLVCSDGYVCSEQAGCVQVSCFGVSCSGTAICSKGACLPPPGGGACSAASTAEYCAKCGCPWCTAENCLVHPHMRATGCLNTICSYECTDGWTAVDYDLNNGCEVPPPDGGVSDAGS